MRICYLFLNMKIGEAIRRKWKEDVIIKSIIWNSVIDVFNVEKNINITPYLVSIQLKWENILIKTNKPIINSELLLLNEEIKKASKKKLLKIWIKLNNFNIKYIH